MKFRSALQDIKRLCHIDIGFEQQDAFHWLTVTSCRTIGRGTVLGAFAEYPTESELM